MYFADPYCAWQKGTNENPNGLLREFYPKGRNPSRVSPAPLIKDLALINVRSKKILYFKTPQDLFKKILQSVILSLTIHSFYSSIFMSVNLCLLKIRFVRFLSLRVLHDFLPKSDQFHFG